MDNKGIKEAIQIYFDATNVSSAELMAEVFHDIAHLYQPGEDNGVLDWDKDFFMGIMDSGEPVPPDKIVNEILAIDYTSEETAVVRLKVRVRDMIYTDILSFIRLNGRWWIIAKLAAGVQI